LDTVPFIGTENHKLRYICKVYPCRVFSSRMNLEVRTLLLIYLPDERAGVKHPHRREG